MSASRAHNYIAAILNTASTWPATQTFGAGLTCRGNAVFTNTAGTGAGTTTTVAGQVLNVVSAAPSAPANGATAGADLNLLGGDATATVAGAAGAAAGGRAVIAGGAAARKTSGNANGGDIVLRGGAPVGTGTTGNVVVTDSAGTGVGRLALMGADGNVTVFVPPAAEGTTRLLTIPPLGGPQTLAVIGIDNAWSISQSFSSTVVPAAANQAGIGSSSVEWLNAYLGESTATASGSGLYLGLAQQWRLWTNSAQHASEATCPANALVLNEGTVPALCILGSAISGFTAASDVAGNAILLGTQAGGTAAAAGKAGGAFTLTTGAGSAGVGATTSGAGGALTLTAGDGATSSGATGTGGAGGSITLTPGAGGAANGGIAGAAGRVRMLSSLGVGAADVTVFVQDATPTALATDDLWYETDTNMWWIWDGTRWVSEQLFQFRATPHVSSYISATSTFYPRFPLHFNGTACDIWIVSAEAAHYTNPGDDTNYYTLDVNKYNSAGAATQVAQLTIKGGQTWVGQSSAVGVAVVAADFPVLGFVATKVGPGSCSTYISASISCRLIHP